MIDDKVYFSIQAWMVNKLGLKGCERDVYAIIYGYSQDGESDYHGSLGYISELTGYSKNAICTALKNLTEKNLIIKKEKEINNIKLVRYTSNFDAIQVTCTPIQVTCTNNKYNKQDNKKVLSKDNTTNFQFGGQRKSTKDNLFTKCLNMVDDYVSKHNCGNPVRNKLVEYLNFRLSVKEKPLYVNMWKGMLNKLDALHKEGYGYEPVIDFCIERGYLSFYPPSNTYTNNKPWEDGVDSTTYTQEELDELSRIDAERKAQGLRTKF